MSERKCKACGRFWPLTDEWWFKHGSTPNGFRHTCKVCNSEQDKQRRADRAAGRPHPSLRLAARRERRDAKIERARALGPPARGLALGADHPAHRPDRHRTRKYRDEWNWNRKPREAAVRQALGDLDEQERNATG